MNPDNIKSPEGVSKEIDAALELLTQLRVGLVKEGCVELEQKAYDVHALLCKLHDTLATSLPPVEGVSDEEIEKAAHAARFHRNQQPNTFEGGVKWFRDTYYNPLQSHLSILSLENKELKEKLDLAQNEKSDLENTISALEDALAAEKAANEKLQWGLNNAIAEERVKNDQVSDLSARLQQAEEKYNNLEAHIRKYWATECDRLKKERDEARDVVKLYEAIKDEREEQQNEIDELRGLVEEMATELKLWTDYDGEAVSEMANRLLTKYNNLKQQSTGLQDHSLADNPAAEEAVSIMLNMASKLDTVFYQRIRMKEAHGEKITIDTFKNRYSLFKKDKEDNNG